MNAELCQLLARGSQSPYSRNVPLVNSGDELVSFEEITEVAIVVKALKKLPQEYQDYLGLCQNSLDIEWELFQGQPVKTPKERDKAVMRTMIERGLIDVG